jgi:hypothetical protein
MAFFPRISLKTQKASSPAAMQDQTIGFELTPALIAFRRTAGDANRHLNTLLVGRLPRFSPQPSAALVRLVLLPRPHTWQLPWWEAAISSAAARPFTSSRSAITTENPSAVRPAAIARPMPLAAPVTTAPSL